MCELPSLVYISSVVLCSSRKMCAWNAPRVITAKNNRRLLDGSQRINEYFSMDNWIRIRDCQVNKDVTLDLLMRKVGRFLQPSSQLQFKRIFLKTDPPPQNIHSGFTINYAISLCWRIFEIRIIGSFCWC